MKILFNYTKVGTEADASLSTRAGLVVDPFQYQDDEFLDSMEDVEDKETK